MTPLRWGVMSLSFEPRSEFCSLVLTCLRVIKGTWTDRQTDKNTEPDGLAS